MTFSERKLNIKSGENMAAYDSLMVFTGNANPELAQRVVKHLDISLGEASVSKFSDGEIAIELMETFVVVMFSFCSLLALQPTTT